MEAYEVLSKPKDKRSYDIILAREEERARRVYGREMHTG